MKMSDWKNRIILITGATSGIGKAAAKEIAKLGSRLVMVVRDQPRGMAAWEEITKASGNDKVELIVADLSSMEEIRILARDFRKRYKHLHVIINNAAIVPAERTVTHDNLEMQFAVNHMAYFLLTNLLLDVVKASAPARIVNTASGTHGRAVLDMNDLQTENGRYKPMEVYGRTKLLNMLFTFELARRLKGTNVTANCYTPGFRATGIGRHLSSVLRFGMGLFGGRPEKGAATLVYLATSPEVEGVNGKYFSNKKALEASRTAQDKDLAMKLWNVSEKIAGLDKRTDQGQ